MASRTVRRLAWFMALLGLGMALMGGYALLARPAATSVVAAVRVLAVLAGASVALGGVLVARERVPVQPVAPFAAAPASLAGAAVVLSTEDVAAWIHAAAGVAVAFAVVGFWLVVAGARGDSS